jgi:hypothetical protein
VLLLVLNAPNNASVCVPDERLQGRWPCCLLLQDVVEESVQQLLKAVTTTSSSSSTLAAATSAPGGSHITADGALQLLLQALRTAGALQPHHPALHLLPCNPHSTPCLVASTSSASSAHTEYASGWHLPDSRIWCTAANLPLLATS